MSLETSFFCQVNHPKDPASLTDLEKKHTPVISAPEQLKAGEATTVTVEIGKLLAHPNEPGHFIEWIDLYANYVFLARLSLTAVTTRPTLKAEVAIPHGLPKVTLRAFARCNVHGVWEAVKEVSVG